jgi:P2-related tail formation protein
MIDETTLSRYLDDLPAIYRQPAPGAHPDFLGRFLLAFEHVLTGVGDPQRPGLEEILDGIAGGNGDDNGDVLLAGTHRYFIPGPETPEAERAPAEFLEWLSSWVALTLREDWREVERRRILAEIVPAYRRRGTPDGLKQILAAFTGVLPSTITIVEEAAGGGDWPPHYFQVRVKVPSILDLARWRAVLEPIIDTEKPAHAYYDLHLSPSATMQVGVTSTVGVDTILSTPD